MRHHDPSNHDTDDLPSRLAPSTPSAPSHPLLLMQRRLGNQAVMRHLQRGSVIQRWIDPTPINITTFPPATVTAQNYNQYYINHMQAEYQQALRDTPRKDRKDELKQAFQATKTELTANVLNHPLLLQRLIALAHKINEVSRENMETTEAMSEPLFGTEFTFTNDYLAPSKNGSNNASGRYANLKIQKWVAEMANKPNVASDEAVTVKGMAAHKFTFENGWWYIVSRDDGCIELQTQPMTQTEGYRDRITQAALELIFEIAASDKLTLTHTEANRARGWQDQRLRTDPLIGGGHLSMDRATTFGNHARAFRNYLVLYVNNHNFWKGFDDDEVNAPMVTELPRAFRREFVAIIGEFDAAYTDPNQPDWTIDQLATAIQARVYKYARQSNQIGSDEHYQAINLEHLNDPTPAKQRMEMRRFRAQTDFNDFMAQIGQLMGLRDEARDFTDNGGLVPLNLDTTTKVESDDIPRGSIRVND